MLPPQRIIAISIQAETWLTLEGPYCFLSQIDQIAIVPGVDSFRVRLISDIIQDMKHKQRRGRSDPAFMATEDELRQLFGERFRREIPLTCSVPPPLSAPACQPRFEQK